MQMRVAPVTCTLRLLCYYVCLRPFDREQFVSGVLFDNCRTNAFRQVVNRCSNKKNKLLLTQSIRPICVSVAYPASQYTNFSPLAQLLAKLLTDVLLLWRMHLFLSSNIKGAKIRRDTCHSLIKAISPLRYVRTKLNTCEETQVINLIFGLKVDNANVRHERQDV